jgi:spore coat polysaccharide biosynthesis predicted glycosyltransferase SpsG
MRTRVVFAANAGALDGSGHLKRCIEYAACLDFTRYSPTIYGDCDFQWLREFASDKMIEINTTYEFAKDVILLIDSYNEKFVNEVSQKIESSEVIQIADPYTPLLQSSKIIWFDAGEIPFELSQRIIASGPKYFPVTKIKSVEPKPDRARNVLISVGGSKQSEVLNRLIESIERNLFPETVFHVLGENEFGSGFRNEYIFYPVGNSIGHLISICDTAITASGVSAWDFLSNGLLLGFFKFVDNQDSNFLFLERNELGLPISRDGFFFDMKMIRALITDSVWRSKSIQNLHGLFDFEWQFRFNELINSVSK